MKRLALAGVAVAASASAAAPQQPAHFGEVARNMRLVAHDDLQGRTAYQVVPHEQSGRWLLYIGHLPGATLNPLTGKRRLDRRRHRSETSALSAAHSPSPAPWFHGDPRNRRGTQHVQVGDGDALPAGKPGAVYLLRTAGNIAHEILDVTNPVQPRFLNEVVRVSGTPHTHKSIPAATDKTRAPAPDNYENGIGPIIHTDNVEVDERGTYLYAVDRANTGLHALELTGEAKRIAEGP